jgi:hypothetical protein
MFGGTGGGFFFFCCNDTSRIEECHLFWFPIFWQNRWQPSRHDFVMYDHNFFLRN